MHLLVYNQSLRVSVTVPGTMTVFDLKEKVAEKTSQPGKPAEWPADSQELCINGKPLQLAAENP